ncbi:hypothetical protein EJ04DRAFT_559763 [Polyplosphaeria fusca]|uniref:Uncharacterized protein n=1 Tax=Polyplosphaeria fusca TaxID=682080 RepID=A0A9P4V7K8_9PLEO|nr:hypothetical protein EJ04DRAFT_559763 [Polyplosphaeria fusca]
MEKYESGYAETIPDDDDDKGSRISNDGSLYEQRTGASGRTESRSKPPSPSSVSSHLPRHASMRNHPTPSDDASVAARWKELLDRETRVAALESELSSQQTRLHYERQALARESHRLMLKELRLRSVEQPLRFRQYSPERPYASMWTPVARHAGPWSERICRMPGLDEMEKEDEEWGNSHGVDGFDGDNDEEDSPGTWPAFL